MARIRLGSVSLDSDDPAGLAQFWASLLGGTVEFSGDDFVAVKIEHLWITAVLVADHRRPTWPEGDVAKQFHLDLAVDDLEGATQRALELGATKAAHQPAPDSYAVLLDPAGHPFCLTTQIPVE